MTKPCKKVMYSTQAFADWDINRIAGKSKRKRIPKRSYFCKICQAWHLTHQNKIPWKRKDQKQ